MNGPVAFVTGANRGLGRAFVEVLLARDVAKVYCGIRDLASRSTLPDDDRVVVVPIDLEKPGTIHDAAERITDVSLLINNAAYASFSPPLGGPLREIEREMRVNYLGTYEVIQALAPTLSRNTGTVVNVLSKLALTNAPNAAGYAASKVALHYMTESLRPVLAAHGVQLFAAYPGGIDTDMLAHYSGPKSSARLVAGNILSAVDEGQRHIFPDSESRGFVRRSALIGLLAGANFDRKE